MFEQTAGLVGGQISGKSEIYLAAATVLQHLFEINCVAGLPLIATADPRNVYIHQRQTFFPFFVFQ